MFMHAGWLHLGGNMLYLWIFGDNVEDRFGHVQFAIFYLLCGLAATFAQLAFSIESNVPNLGASGAIAGVLGAYILLFPKGRVRVLQGQGVVQVPALIVIGVLDRAAVLQRHRLDRRHGGHGRGGLHGAHRRLRRRVRADLPVPWPRRDAAGGLSRRHFPLRPFSDTISGRWDSHGRIRITGMIAADVS